MTNGIAVAICKDIRSEKYSVNEKGLAIHQMLSMATHNGITKQELIDVLMWLWHEHFVMAGVAEILGERAEE